jgi:tetratricopeptide (TPR) repeat protein
MRLTAGQMGRLDRLLDQAQDLDPQGRRKWLEGLPAEDADLLPVLRAALLEEPAASLEAPRLSSPEPEAGEGLAAGQRVGPWELLRPLGKGGMAQVWLARRADGAYEREVALKIPVALHLRGDMAARFARERDILASLEHPQIARFYDAGLGREGMPYLALEYVRGKTLTSWCEARQLDLRQRIELFLQVLDAVQYAHDQGVLHRDIKPSNVMVNEAGQVRLLDFGVARMLERSDTRLTQVYGRALTPEYASPEQLAEAELGPASDVYSLGRLLSELLTGELPRCPPDGQPEPPSARAQARATGQRPGATGRIARLLKGDLDAIVLKALAARPEDRYGSAQELALDLRCYLNQEPVSARPGHWSYRAGKLLKRHRTQAASVALSIAAVGAALGYALSRHPEAPAGPAAPLKALADRSAILLADWRNDTKDPVFDLTLRQAVAVQLEQAPQWTLVSDQRIGRTLALMKQPKGTAVTAQLALELCQRAGGAALIDGTIAQLGQQYVLGMHAQDCHSGETLANVQVRANGKEAVLQAVDAGAGSLRRKLGESAATLQRFHTPIDEVTTHSLEALNAYSLGRAAADRNDDETAVAYFRRAIEIDARFAMAYAALSASYFNLYEGELAAQSIRKAYEMRQHLSERERFYVESRYYQDGTGELDQARVVDRQWAQLYPNDSTPHIYLQMIDATLGDHPASLAEAREGVAQSPSCPICYGNLVIALIRLNEVGQAKAVAADALARGFDTSQLHSLLFMIAKLERDEAGMQRQLAWSEKNPGFEDEFLSEQAMAAVAQGNLARAREFSERSIRSALSAKLDGVAASYEIYRAWYEALCGDASAARGHAAQALKLDQDRYTRFGAALSYALAGDAARATQIAGELASRFSLDTLVERLYLPTIRGAVELAGGNAASAIEKLAPALPYETGIDVLMFPAYLRGQAYMALGDATRAAGEFRKVVGQRGLLLAEEGSAVYSMGRLQLARALAQGHQTQEAKAAYRSLLDDWKQADPRFAGLLAATAEAAKLD